MAARSLLMSLRPVRKGDLNSRQISVMLQLGVKKMQNILSCPVGEGDQCMCPGCCHDMNLQKLQSVKSKCLVIKIKWTYTTQANCTLIKL